MVENVKIFQVYELFTLDRSSFSAGKRNCHMYHLKDTNIKSYRMEKKKQC